jgi:hypothetical protein
MLRELREALAALDLEIDTARITPKSLAELMRLVDEGRTTARSARELMPVLVKDGGDPAILVRERGLEAVSDAGVLDAAVAAVIAGRRALSGCEEVLNFLIGRLGRTGGYMVRDGSRRLAQALRGLQRHARRLAAGCRAPAAVALAVLLHGSSRRASASDPLRSGLGRELDYFAFSRMTPRCRGRAGRRGGYTGHAAVRRGAAGKDAPGAGPAVRAGDR